QRHHEPPRRGSPMRFLSLIPKLLLGTLPKDNAENIGSGERVNRLVDYLWLKVFRRFGGPQTIISGDRQNKEAAHRPPPRHARSQRSSASRPVEASTVGLTGTRTPDSTQARWLGAKRGANRPSFISRVTAKRLKAVGGR